ncbi:MAG: hypothetical protein NXI32_20760, partial [bacterium]|nr:hypothetical protein [bacterium]
STVWRTSPPSGELVHRLATVATFWEAMRSDGFAGEKRAIFPNSPDQDVAGLAPGNRPPKE